MITLQRDTLTFSFPEIGREVRSLIKCTIKQIAAELPSTWDRAALISKIESDHDFSKLSTEEQEFARESLRTWVPANVEARLESAILDAGGLSSDSFIRLSVKFQRARRIPNDGKSYPLPTDLGQLPLRSVDDFAETAPTSWLENGGVVMPLAESEAPWIWFSSPYRFAIKIGFRDADVLSSEPWGPALDKWPRNYLVIPDLSSEEGSEVIRRFVNIPLDGESTPTNQHSENAHTEAIHLQITPVRAESYYEDERGCLLRHNIEEFFRKLVFGPLISKQSDEFRRRHERWDIKDHPFEEFTSLTWKDARYQDIPVDPYRFADWDRTRAVRCCVHVCDPTAWHDLQRVKTRRHTEIREFLDAP